MYTNEETQLYIHLSYKGELYYIADSAITSNYTYWPFLAESPTIGYSGEGYLKINSGSLSILKDYDGNENHPFSGDRYLEVLTKVQEIPIEIYMGSDLIPMFSGTIALESVTESLLNFTIMEEEFEESLVYPVLDEDRSETEEILFVYQSDVGFTAVIKLLDNPFSDGEEVIFEKLNIVAGVNTDSLIYDRIKDNRYIVTDRTTTFFRLFDKEEPDHLITIDDLGINSTSLSLKTGESLIESAFSLSSGQVYNLPNQQIYNIGYPRTMPFSFGDLQIRSPIIRYGDKKIGGNFRYLIKNPQIDFNDSTTFHLYDGGVEITDNVIISESDASHIALLAYPVDEIAISGKSFNGQTIESFFELCCQYLTGNHLGKSDEIDMENLDLQPDFSMAPHASTTKISIFQESDITVLEMATQVAETTNYLFYFSPFTDSNGEYKRKMKVIDINEVLFNDDLYPVEKEIREDDQISINLQYPYPIKAIESSITVNRLYQGIAEEEKNRSQMRSVNLDFRVDVHSIGNIENENVFAQSVSEGKKWLQRKKATSILPKIQIEMKDIQKEVTLGTKLRVFDFVRDFMADLIVSDISYDFSSRSTMVQGVGVIKTMERY